jgi:hypothetical protein
MEEARGRTTRVSLRLVERAEEGQQEAMGGWQEESRELRGCALMQVRS